MINNKNAAKNNTKADRALSYTILFFGVVTLGGGIAFASQSTSTPVQNSVTTVVEEVEETKSTSFTSKSTKVGMLPPSVDNHKSGSLPAK